MISCNTSRSKQLLNKVYDHLDSIDVSKLSMNDLKDFLGVVQQGQFMESFGQAHALTQFCCAPFNGPSTDKPSGDGGDKTEA